MYINIYTFKKKRKKHGDHFFFYIFYVRTFTIFLAHFTILEK